MTKPKSKLREAYYRQKSAAKRRGIEWLFTFDTWLDVWDSSGHLHERGQGADGYCMARHGDVGPYSPENVRITTNHDNCKENGEVIAARWAFFPTSVGGGWAKPSKRQQQVLQMIARFQADNGMPPTYAEVAGAFGWRSANAATEHIKALEKKGYVKRVPEISRGLRLTPAADKYVEAA